MPFIDLDSVAPASKSPTPAVGSSTVSPVITPIAPVTQPAPTPVSTVIPAAPVPEASHPLFSKISAQPQPAAPVAEPESEIPVIPTVSLNESTDIAGQDSGQLTPPQVNIQPGVQLSTHETGVREFEGPGFEHPAEPKIESQPIETKLANLSNMAAELEKPTDKSAEPVEDTADEQKQKEVETEITFDKLIPDSISDAPKAPTPSTVKSDTPITNDVKSLSEKTYSLADYCRQAIELDASDLHISVGYRAMVRVNGGLIPIKSQVITESDIAPIVEEVLHNRLEKLDINKISDLDVAYETQGVRFRVNIFRQKGNLSLAFRLIPENIRTIEELKLPPIVKEFAKFPQGLVLVTGPTGSGKSTTIASIINSINLNESKHIITIEDPIEYVYPKEKSLIEQRAIYDDTPTWEDALKYVLRQDPDIVSIGEMRDYETVSSAIRIAETGHLVFATLHTNSAAQTIDRIIDIFPSHQQNQIRAQLASVLSAVLSQRLVPVSTGGRRVVAELMLGTTGVRSSIREAKTYLIDNMIQTSAELGMMTMEKSLVGLIREGLITTEEAQALSTKPDEILALLSNKYGNV